MTFKTFWHLKSWMKTCLLADHSYLPSSALTHLKVVEHIILVGGQSGAFSVTRFGKILPLWQKPKCLCQFYQSLFSIWQTMFPTLAHFVQNWAIFHGCKCKNNVNYLVTLDLILWKRHCCVRLFHTSLGLKNKIFGRKVTPGPRTNVSVAYLLYPDIKQSIWLKIVMWLATLNQRLHFSEA